MSGFRKTSISTALLLLIFIPIAQGLNLGLLAGNLKRHSSPLVIKKYSKHAPVFINVNSLSKAPLFPKLPPKPPPLKTLGLTKPSKKLPRSILPPFLPPILPKLPLLPILPILPPILPPLIPLLPILPPLSLLPGLKSSLNPLRVPILKESPLKDLESKLKLVKVPPVKVNKKDDILSKLLDLKKKGDLTTAEYIKFRKLLLRL